MEDKKIGLIINRTIQTLNNWEKVENGQLVPKSSINISGDKKSYLHFKIPLMLRTIGACNK